MVNYVKLAETAQRLVKKNGREVTFIRFNTAPTVSDAPWRGNEQPRQAPTAQKVFSAVFVGPSAAMSLLGNKSTVADLFMSCEQVCIVATTDDLKDYNEVMDSDGRRWKIVVQEKLAPGPVTLLYYVGVKR